MVNSKTMGVLASVLFLGALTGVAMELKAPKNFIVIFADDFGYGDMGCCRELFQGGDDLTLSHKFTPNLDREKRGSTKTLTLRS